MKHNWNLRPPVPDATVSALGFPYLQSQLLYNRGMSSREVADAFLSPNESDVCDPTLMPDMEKAVSRLRRAIEEGERVGVFGDFDIDGISGSAVVIRGLGNLGADVEPYIPNRNRLDEGHGLTRQAVRAIADMGVSLLITVDCGSYDTESVEFASSLGMDVIITDHHSVLEDIPALAFINSNRPGSKYPFRHLAGVGTVYKLMQALYEDAGRDEPSELLEFVALGTVSDVVPLIGENRYFVSEGLRRMNRSSVPGLRALIEASGNRGKALDTSTLSFGLIPRLNAPGRLHDERDADGMRYMALNLLMTADSQNAQYMAADMEISNKRRQALTEEGVAQARAQVTKRWGRSSLPGIIMVGHRDWKPGIVGLIASKLVDMYNRPAIAVSVGESESRASARTIPGFDIFEPIQKKRDLLIKFGGHKQAAGFSVSNESLRTLADYFEEVSEGVFDTSSSEPPIEVDVEAGPSVVAKEAFDFTQKLAPFGKSNPQPMFASGPLRVVKSFSVGAGKHLKLTVADDDGSTWDAIAFRQGGRVSRAAPGSHLDVAYRMELNTWRGRDSLQLVVEDFAPSEKS